MANHMADVAKMLGVEIEERFKIFDGYNILSFEYYFSSKGLMMAKDNGSIYIVVDDTLRRLLNGTYTIKKAPWKPEHGHIFWYINADGYACKKVLVYTEDINYYKLGNCYKTKEEAEANKDKWVKFYSSDDILEV